MKKNFSKKRSAFSLIELSIVLIVIGLLIAGITGGASLIKSSELRSVMGEARGYAVSVNAFYSQFNGLPGDYGTAVTSNDVFGNNDGHIDFIGTGTVFEAQEAWRDLKAIGAIDSVLTILAGTVGPVAPAQAFGANIPTSKIKSAGWSFDYNTTSLQNVVVLTGSTTAGSKVNTPTNGATVSVGVILPADALAIDSKIDDTAADTGKVRAVNPANGTACAGGTVSAPGATYAVTTSTKVCALSYQVDVNS